MGRLPGTPCSRNAECSDGKNANVCHGSLLPNAWAGKGICALDQVREYT